MEQLNASCETARLALGAYALRALDPAEGDAVRAHLEGCAACRDELATLTAVAGALGRLTATEALATGAEAAAPGLLRRAIAEVARRRRRFRLQVAGAGVAVALAVAGAATGVTLATRPPIPAAVPAAAHLAGTDPHSGVAATADVYAESWGTSIHMRISGVSPGERCHLVAVARDGSEEVAGSWHVGYSGAAVIEGATGMTPAQLVSLRVVTADGTMLVALTMPTVSAS